MARFVAKQIVRNLSFPKKQEIRVLDPAVGDGELLLAISDELHANGYKNFSIHGFDTNPKAIELAGTRLRKQSNTDKVHLEPRDFLSYVLDHHPNDDGQAKLFEVESTKDKFDLVIANPPYVRTQVLGSDESKKLSEIFGLSGRTDLYHAFILAIVNVLEIGGELGIIVSNRFMTTKSGMSVRECFLTNFHLHHVFDLGDTKLFDEAVLPAVIIGKRDSQPEELSDIPFTRSHSTKTLEDANREESVLKPIEEGFDGVVSIGETCFEIVQGSLDFGKSHSDVWRVSTEKSSQWLATVEKHQRFSFRDVGKIRVGVKTTADKVFISRDWEEITNGREPEDEVLMPLLTHKEARRWVADNEGQAKILYTHEVVNGKRQPIDFKKHPNALRYLEGKRESLEKRSYVIKAGRQWYEIWVPHNPLLWSKTKLVFRDIAENSTFFIDTVGSVINGDCYWMVLENDTHPDILWLAMAVGNSSFILKFYDERFHNKLYANRRRFMTQYVEQFPIPDPISEIGQELVQLAKKAYKYQEQGKVDLLKKTEETLDARVWEAFGLVKE